MNQLMSTENTLLLVVFSILNTFLFYVLGPASEDITYVAGTDWSMIKLLTTHFSHHSELHLWGNISAMAILLALFSCRNDSLMLSFITCMVITACCALYNKINYFLGFSALLYCIPGCYFAATLSTNKFVQAIVILFTLCLYLFFISPIKYTDQEIWLPFTAAHAIGFFSGTMAQLVLSVFKADSDQNGQNHPPH